MTDQQVSAGWYPRPGMTGTLGYWDGTNWTEQVAPMGTTAAAAPANVALLVLGYVLAVLFPLGGMIVAAILWRQSNTHAWLILVFSGISALLWYQIVV